MFVPIQWAADTECPDCKGRGFKNHCVMAETDEGEAYVLETFRVVCKCVENRLPPLT